MRETTKITLPSGAVAEIYAYLTGREKKAINEVLFKSAQFDIGETEKKTAKPRSTISGSAIFEAQDLTLKFLMHSLNGETLNAYERILDLSAKDYDFLIAEINKFTQDQVFLAA